MYLVILKGIIVSYSKNKLKGSIYTETKGLEGGEKVLEKSKTGTNSLGEDIYEIIFEKTEEQKNSILIKKKNKINMEFQKLINQFTAGYSQAEIDSWKTKEEEAKVVSNGGSSDFIDILCISGETSEELATKIINNATNFKLAYAEAEKNKREKIKALNI